MNASRRLISAALLIPASLIVLAACAPKPHLTTLQVQGVMGLSMEEVKAKLGGPHVITNAGDSVWWDYDDVTTPDGNGSVSCQVVFKKDTVSQIKC
jgi:hypothetical protein